MPNMDNAQQYLSYFYPMKHIASAQNALLKHIDLLQRKSKTRKQENAFVVEGQREVNLCDHGGFILKTLLVCPQLFCGFETVEPAQVYKQLGIAQQPEVVTVTQQVYEKIAYRAGTEGCIAIATTKTLSLAHLNLNKNPLILVAEGVEKPGNIGALLRTADAANLDAVILTNALGDVYNPNVIRSSVGCVFTVPVAMCTTAELVVYLKEKKINLYAATLQSSVRYDLVDFTAAAAIAVGTEATGLTQEMRDAATAGIIIPMHGAIDSMNVSVSASILIFEAKRQRGF